MQLVIEMETRNTHPHSRTIKKQFSVRPLQLYLYVTIYCVVLEI